MKMKLSRRERNVLIGAAAFLLVLGLYLLVDSSVQRYHLLEKKIVTKKAEIRQISRLRAEYLEAHRQLANIKKQLDRGKKGFSILSFIEDLAKKENMRENIGSVKPKKMPLNDAYEEHLVEIHMENVSLPDLVDFIYRIEHSGHLLKVKRLRIKTRYDNRDLLNVTLQVTTYVKKA